MVSISEPIATGVDDGSTDVSAGAYVVQDLIDTGLRVRRVDSYGSITLDYVGLRFQTVAIPQGETIHSATLTTARTSFSGSGTIRFYGNDVDDAAAWGTANRIKDITKTAANAAADTGAGTVTHDVASIVQELVNRAGWVSGNDMAFAAFPPAGTDIQWRFAAYEHATLASAVLDISFGAQSVAASLDAILQKQANLKTASVDAALLAQFVKTASVDAALLAQFVKTASVDGRLANHRTETASVDAALLAQFVKTASVDAALLAQFVKTASVDGRLANHRTETASVDAALLAQFAKATSVSGALRGTQRHSASLDALLRTGFWQEDPEGGGNWNATPEGSGIWNKVPGSSTTWGNA